MKLKKGYNVKVKDESFLYIMRGKVGKIEAVLNLNGTEQDDGCFVCVSFLNWSRGGDCLGTIKSKNGWMFKRESLEITNDPLTDCSNL